MEESGSRPRPIRNAASPVPRLASAALLRGGRRVYIEHRGDTYRLELTRQGKLILTK